MTCRKRKSHVVFVALVFIALFCAGCAQTPNASSPTPDSKKVGAAAPAPSGDLLVPQPSFESEGMTAEEEEEIDRAIRAYKPPKEAAPFVNKAPEFTYRSLLTSDQRNLYDAIVSLFNDPTNVNNYVKAKLSGITQAELDNAFAAAGVAVSYDHPELFWFHASADWPFCYWYSDGETSFKDVKLSLRKPYSSYEEDMREFNAAVDRFLADIDLSQSDALIALDIHDKLIGMASYDDDLYSANKNDLGHTAFGALVRNGAGDSNRAVCDGYSLAYEYLLQQAGIQAAVVVGDTISDTGERECHAWNVVKLDGDWYEVDITWDDAVLESPDNVYDKYLKFYPNDVECAEHLRSSCYDEDYSYRVRHYMYNLTTSEMEHFDPGDTYTYYHDDGWNTYLCGPSTRSRAGSNGTTFYDAFDPVITKLPIAYGTTYAFSNGPQNWPTPSKSTKPAEGATSSDSDEYVLPDSSERVYKFGELDSMSDHTLFLARNEIFARHGGGFKTPELRTYFSSKSWYHETLEPGSYGVEILNSVEKKNVETMLGIERGRNSPYI